MKPGPTRLTIGERIADARIEAGLSQGELAREMRQRGHRWAQDMVSRIERDIRYVRVHEWWSMQEFLDLPNPRSD